MSSSKLIVVVGATGYQGGSVADTFLSDPQWRVRALTRNTSSTKAQALAGRGAEVIYVDLNDPSTLAPALFGAQVIFAVSDFFGLYGDPANKDKPTPGQPLNVWAAKQETQQLKNIIDAAANVTNLEAFIFSSLAGATKNSKGKYTHVYQFDSKAEAEEYGKETYPDLWAITRIFQAGFYLSNFVTNPMMQPTKGQDGVVRFISNLDPDKKFPFIAAEKDSGPIIKALLQEPAVKNVLGCREQITLREFVVIFTRVTGLPAQVTHLPKGQLGSEFPPELKVQLIDNWAYLNEYRYEGEASLTVIRPDDLEYPPKLGTVLDYVEEQDWSRVLSSA